MSQKLNLWNYGIWLDIRKEYGEKSMNQHLMHGSIPTVTIPPGHTPGGWHPIPYPGHKKRGNSPPLGHSTASCTVAQEDRNIYYIYNKKIIEGKITECWLADKESIFLIKGKITRTWLVKHQNFSLLVGWTHCSHFLQFTWQDFEEYYKQSACMFHQLLTNWKYFPAKKSACWFVPFAMCFDEIFTL